MSIFQELKAEHKNINKFIPIFYRVGMDVLGGSVNIRTLNFCLDFVENYIEAYHHGKEEEVLFPIAGTLELLKGGGPQCTPFYGKFLDTNFNHRIKEQVSMYPEIKKYKPRDGLRDIFIINSPLTIPLDEHEQSYYLVQIMRKEILRVNEWEDVGHFTLSKMIRWCSEVLRNHIEKEDECLFVRLEALLSNKQLEELDVCLNEFNSKNNEFKLRGLNSLSSLQNLYNIGAVSV